VKARAYLWTQSGDPTGERTFFADAAETTDRRVLASLMRDLTAAPDAAVSHPDAAIFEADRALAEVDVEVGRAATRCDEVAAKREGREITAADKAALDAAGQAYEAALDALIALSPQTVAGLHRILKAMARDCGYDRETTIAALVRLVDCPALGGEA